MPRDYKVYLEDILISAEKIGRFLEGISYEHFITHEMLLDAVLFNLEVLGEAAKHIPEEVRERYPTIEWRSISGLRNIIVHEYFRLNLRIIWDTVQNELPALRRSIADILAEGDA
jgi:uncharacterized protein with HEPN domain